MLFTARFTQLLIWDSQVRTYRLVVAGGERLDGGAAAYYDAMFGSGTARLHEYLRDVHGLTDLQASAGAEELFARIVLPRLLRVTLGVDAPLGEVDPDSLATDVNLAPIREIVDQLLPRARRARGSRRP